MMNSARRHAKGFTLIASLLMLLLLSGLAIGLLMMVNTEGKVGGTDLQNNLAFHAADGGIEKLASDLSATFTNAQSPHTAAICGVGGPPWGSASNEPAMVGVTWTQYSVTPASGCSIDPPNHTWGQILSGPNTGLWAQIIPINMLATAALSGGQEVSMTRGAQVALIPVFQFGVFCEGDCGFFDSPNLTFAGRVHTNSDLYLGVAAGNTLTFNNKLEAYGNVVTEVLPNGLSASSFSDTGNVYIPTAVNGCSTTTTNCVLKAANGGSAYGDGSVTGAGSSTPQSGGSYNATNWNPFSKTSSNYMLINGNYGSTTTPGTGAKRLSMPFVTGTTFPYQIIRRPLSTDSTALSESREYNLAEIHVLLSDDPAELPGGASDANNIRLANIPANSAGTNPNLPYGIPTSFPSTFPALTGGSTYNMYFAHASNAIPSNTCTLSYGTSIAISCPPDWPYPPAPWTTAMQTAVGAGTDSDSTYPNCVLLCGFPDGGAANPGGPPPFISNNGATLAGSSTLSGTGTSNIVPPTLIPCPTATMLKSGTAYAPLPAAIPAACTAANLVAWPVNPPTTTHPYYPLVGGTGYTEATADTYLTSTWNLIDGWLRVEYKDASGVWHPVTNEWLQLGFARGLQSPTVNGSTAPAAGTNPINPNAILLLQEPADRVTNTNNTFASSQAGLAAAETALGGAGVAGNGGITGTAPVCTATSSVSGVNYCKAWTVTAPQVLTDTAALATSGIWQFGVTTTAMATSPGTSTLGAQSLTRFNWYPINFYDAREGEPRDTVWSTGTAADNTCTANGIMNAVEIDVGNLKRWLTGAIGSSGTSVDYVAQNGYVLYYSDRRGMLPNPNAFGTNFIKSGDSGLEDVINSSSAAGTPDGVLEPIPAGRSLSPEDVNQNGLLDAFGDDNLGLGFYGTGANPNINLDYFIVAANPNDQFGTASYASRINSCASARKNWVSGARHVLKLVDGSLGNVPNSPTGTAADPGGFTVASENPVYIQGDYNSNSGDNFWPNGVTTGVADLAGHSSAAIIADAVTILSNNWVDQYSTLGNPNGGGNNSPTLAAGNRAGATTYYRVAVAGGKNIAFPFPGWETATDYGFGTDGGIHNFLRYLEDWQTTGATLNYGGSLVSLYYATYNTGVFKCCEYSVYQPPTRNYIFDADFTLPSGLPPGTPMFRDVESLSYRQLFTTRQTGQ